jgi:Protein of unknown function (DUF3455)
MTRARFAPRFSIVLTGFAAGLIACSSDNSDLTDGGNDASYDATQDATQDVAKMDAGSDVVTQDASDGGCPSSWTALPTADPSLAVPDGGGGLLIHAAGSGTQNYTCEGTATDAGTTTYAWTFVGPAATLDDCSSNVIGHHFASEAGAAAPEWQTLDKSYVIGKKLVAFTPDGGSASVPWLLLEETSSGGSGTISSTLFVQRLFTDGGVAPTTTCDSTTVGNTVDQPYTADYYFYGP